MQAPQGLKTHRIRRHACKAQDENKYVHATKPKTYRGPRKGTPAHVGVFIFGMDLTRVRRSDGSGP